MPELPEVETVRRGLAPAMEGAALTRVEVRHRGLRWPIAKDFEKRLTGATVTGLGRRAKYLLADLSTGDVLIMHLGMSGSFRIDQGKAGRIPPRALERRKARPCRVPSVERQDGDLQRSAPLRLDEDRAARQARRRAAVESARAGAARQRIRCGHAGARLRRQKDFAESRAARSARRRPVSAISMSARRCSARICRRSGAPRPSPTARASRTNARSHWSMPSRRC